MMNVFRIADNKKRIERRIGRSSNIPLLAFLCRAMISTAAWRVRSSQPQGAVAVQAGRTGKTAVCHKILMIVD